jgi:ASC-1-like (ASCH) protein
MKNIIKIEDTGTVIKDIEERFWDIPFENSDFQNKKFVVDAQITPGRAYRSIGLRLSSKLRAVKEYKYGLELRDVDIDEKQAIIDNPDATEFDKRRADIEIRKLRDMEKYEQKLLNDALREITCLYQELEKYPRYTREQFEAEEQKHFELVADQRLNSPTEDHVMLSNMSRSGQIVDEILQLYNDDPNAVVTYMTQEETE